MNILSPCLISIILILGYLFLSKQNKSKVKTIINQYKILIILFIVGYIYMNYEGDSNGCEGCKGSNGCEGCEGCKGSSGCDGCEGCKGSNGCGGWDGKKR